MKEEVLTSGMIGNKGACRKFCLLTVDMSKYCACHTTWISCESTSRCISHPMDVELFESFLEVWLSIRLSWPQNRVREHVVRRAAKRFQPLVRGEEVKYRSIIAYYHTLVSHFI
jgi:hypothetical protein